VVQFVRDLLFAVRKFRRSPGLTIAAIVTLTLGIGANTAIFSLVDALWLRPLPIADPSHLVAIQSEKARAAADSEHETGSSFAEFEDIRASVPAFADVIAVSGRGVVLDQDGTLKLLVANVVSENYFSMVGTHALLGRLPSSQEMLHAETPVMVLGYGAWKSVFAGNPGVVGTTVKLSHGSAQIVGVLPRGFRGTNRFLDPQVYVSRSGWLVWDPDDQASKRTIRDFDLYARLRPGVTLDQGREQLRALSARLAAAYPDANSNRSFTAAWEPQTVNKEIRLLSMLLLAIAAAVLLIACTNILNLLLALADARHREIAMRVALGATRARLLRQLLAESCFLAFFSIAGAIFLAQWLIALVPSLMPDIGYPIGFDLRIDLRVLAFTAAASLLSVLLCGLIPGISSSQVAPIEATRTALLPAGRLKMPARKIFVIAQLTISTALLMATALLIQTLVHVETMDIGFNRAQKALLLDVGVSRDGPQKAAEFQALADRMRALPGVKDASVARVVPFPDSGSGATQMVLAAGEVPSPTAGTPVWFNWIDDAYFRVVGVPLLRGRTFEKRDAAASAQVAIVNQTLARKLFGSEDVIGRHFRIGRDKPVDTEIVGVARDGKYGDITETPQPYLYLPLTQNAWSEVMLIATTTKDPRVLMPAARKAVQEVDPEALVLTAQTLEDHMSAATYTNRMAAWLTASLGCLALLLTLVGLYGVTAYLVSRQTHEIGIRMALGARRDTVFKSVLAQGLRLSLIGVVLGTALSFFLGRAITSLLYGVKATDPMILCGVIGLIFLTSISALISPARRAVNVNPVDALRHE